jgi:tRNA A-37 threonylcarbamoyl transferase component Bud32
MQVSRAHLPAARAAGLIDAPGFDALLKTARRVRGGRGANYILDPDAWECSVRLRPARHGGVLGGFLGERFGTPGRIAREFDRWCELVGRGVALPTPVLAISRRRGLFWHSALASIEETGARDGAEWLEAGPSPARIRAAARAFAHALRRFHDAGGIHGDLHMRNILVREHDDAIDCCLIDLDRTRLRASVPASSRMRDLMRLARSLDKRGASALLSKRIRSQVLSDYCQGDRGLRRSMMHCARSEARRLARHRFAWRLARLLHLGNSRSLASTAIAMVVATFQFGCPGEPPEDPGNATSRAPHWSLLVTGDTGRHRAFAELLEGQLSVSRQMTLEAEREPVDGLVLLGDNFYWHGLERATAVDRIRTNLVRPYCHFLGLDGPRSGEVADACPIDETQRRAVPLFAVLGNHDLESPESAELQRTFVPEFLPDWQMSDGIAEVREVTPGVSLILFESELAIRDEAAIKTALHNAIRASRGPWRILVTHRPIATDDLGFPPHGGYPIWVREALAESGRPVQLVLAGHHHNIQAFELGPPTPLLHVGVGSGSRAEPPLAQDHPDARFGAVALGFVRVDLVGDGPDERLSVSIFDSAPWPWLGYLRSTRLRARFDVDEQGRVEQLALP